MVASSVMSAVSCLGSARGKAPAVVVCKFRPSLSNGSRRRGRRKTVQICAANLKGGCQKITPAQSAPQGHDNTVTAAFAPDGGRVLTAFCEHSATVGPRRQAARHPEGPHGLCRQRSVC